MYLCFGGVYLPCSIYSHAMRVTINDSSLCFAHVTSCERELASLVLIICQLVYYALVPRVLQKDVGHVLLKLPQAPKAEHQHSSPANELADVRTKDGLHLSPRKLHAACAKLVHTSLLKHGVDKDQVHLSLSPSDLTMSVQLPCGWHAELVPCVAAPTGDTEGVYYVSRYRMVRSDVEEESGAWESVRMMVVEALLCVCVCVRACVRVCVFRAIPSWDAVCDWVWWLRGKGR